MAITLVEATNIIESEGFNLKRSTSKIAEYESASNSRVLYLRVDQGFPDHADIAIHPEVDPIALLAIPEIAANKRVELRFSSNMSQFPKRLNGGEEPEHYGRALYAYSTGALARLCQQYGHST